jgi:L-lactate dehydrogenase complex protein LldF
MLRDAAAHSGNVSACSLCMSCDQVCPVQVDLSQQIYRWRQRLEVIGQANAMKKLMSQGMTILFNHPALYTATLRLSPAANWLPSALMNSALNPWARGHQMMKFPKKSFHALWNELSKKS